jgi:excisionase family DNA binding protein
MSFNRLDPSQMDPAAIAELSGLLASPGHIALSDEAGNRVELPAPLFAFFTRMVQAMQERRPIVLIPEDEALTTQAAANHLGVSRQHLVNLLEDETIPYHKVGTHRRVYFRDLVAYERERDTGRRKALDALADAVDDAGLYDASYTGDDES